MDPRSTGLDWEKTLGHCLTGWASLLQERNMSNLLLASDQAKIS